MHPKSLATAAAAALFALAPLARAEIVERIAGIVNGQPIALSEVRERVSIELQKLAEKVPAGPERDRQTQSQGQGLSFLGGVISTASRS